MEKPSRLPASSGSLQAALASYLTVRGVRDEMLELDGSIRPIWRPLIDAVGHYGPEGLHERFGRADRYLRDAGVYFRVYGETGGQEREWPLSHLPVLVSQDEWSGIAEGLAQRADLLEAVVSDIYGQNRLVADGLLPPYLIGSNPHFLRPLVGVRPPSGHFLHFCAFELGRGPDGRWWVLADRTQAPSGAGFALENRVATTRSMPEVFAAMNVPRLAGFFRDFREALFGMVRSQSDRVAILTPGIHNDTYFEHAYIARYLGLLLLEGEDLTVADGRLMVRTVSGLKPVSVLWRRLDASFLDPLELDARSQIGTPGMVEAIRGGALSMVNAPGSGILETRALLAFLPSIASALRGEELSLPGIATWWCGQDAERAHVEANLDRLVTGEALSTMMPIDDPDHSVLGRSLEGEGRRAFLERLGKRGHEIVAQEAVTLSTTPAYRNGRLEPRPVILRAFACRTPDGWSVMPGGFARIGDAADTAAIAMQRGGQAADVWIVAKDQPEQVSLLPREGVSVHRTDPGSLPSRAADNLLWLGRYIERAEVTVRILRAYHARLADGSSRDSALMAEIATHLDSLDVDASEAVPNGLLQAIDSTVASAGRIRDRFSPDGWTALNDLSRTVHRFADAVKAGDDATRAMSVLLRKIAGFSGLVHENMYRFTGWRFLEIGRRLERGIQMAHLLGRLAREEAPDGSLDMLLEIGDSVMTHRRRYSVTGDRFTVIDLLALDAYNPRSVLFQVEALKQELELLPGAMRHGQRSPIARDILRLHTELAVADPLDLSADRLSDVSEQLGELAAGIARAYL